MTNPIVIIGGDAAGMSAASKAKRLQRDAHIIVFERDQHISYAACGMPYWLGGVIDSDEKLKALTVEAAREKRGIDVRIRHEVEAIDLTRKTVRVRNLDSGETFTQAYDKLMIATGASASMPPVPGLDLPGVFSLRSLTDAQHIRQYLQETQPRRAVIIGAGYIGLEMAEAMRARSMETTVVEMLPHIMPNYDADMVDDVARHLAEQGVKVLTSARVEAVEARDGGLMVSVDAQPDAIPADVVIVSTGVRPNVKLAKEAGIRLGETGAIWVDSQMRTSAPDVFAAGDCVEYPHRVLKRNVWIPLAPAANKTGRIAGENMVGGHAEFPGILGTAIVKVFDYTMTLTGVTETVARENQELFGPVDAVTITEKDKAGYYPGAEPIRVKVVFRKEDGRILGAQMVGKSGVGKRIDTFVTAISAGMTLAEFSMLDLAYAPPYSPVYDPVLVAANVGLKKVGVNA